MTTMTLCKIACCICGTMIVPNGANQCSSCLAQDFDLRGELHGNKHELLIHQCRECRRYEQQSVKTSSKKNIYRHMEWESPQLLALCLKSIPGLNSNQQQGDSNNSSKNAKHKRFQLLDAIWVYTEPHSKRIKVRVTIKTEVHNVLVQQRLIVEFRIQWQQCVECKNEYTNRTWHALVQVRQKRGDVNVGGSSSSNAESSNNNSNYHNHNTALAKLEMGIYNNPSIRKHVLEIDTTKNGFDFYFLKLNQAQTFANFVTKISPCKKIKSTSKLISTDSKSNTANMKHTITCDIIPMCKHDLICITKSLAAAKGGGGMHLQLCGKLALVTNITNNIHIIDVSPQRNVIDVKNKCMSELSPDHYFKMDKHAVPILLSSSRLIKFVVLDVELLTNENNHDLHHDENDNASSNKNKNLPYALAEIQVMRESDFGLNDEILMCVSHLGNILQSGDIVLGYDILNNPMLVEELESNNSLHSNYILPDIVLVKKLKPEKELKRKKKKKKQQQQQQQQNKEGRILEVVNEDAEEESDPVVSKKEKRRLQKQQKKNENNYEGEKKKKKKREPKRMRELIQSAERMGFLGDNDQRSNKDDNRNKNNNECIDESDDDDDDNDDDDDDDDDSNDDNDDLFDKNLLADLSALENDLEQISSSKNNNDE